MSPGESVDWNQTLQRHRARIIAASEAAEVPFIERKFIVDEKWRRYSASEAFRYSSILREKESSSNTTSDSGGLMEYGFIVPMPPLSVLISDVDIGWNDEGFESR